MTKLILVLRPMCLRFRASMSIARWSTLDTLLSSNTARFIYTLPLAGYVILYSDYFQSLHRFAVFSNSPGFLSFSTRINLIYYGSLFLLLIFGLYYWFCPPRIRGKRDLQNFISQIVAARDRSTVLHISREEPFNLGHEAPAPFAGIGVDQEEFRNAQHIIKNRGSPLGAGAGEYDHDIPLILGSYYKWQNIRKPRVRAVIFAGALIGYVLVLLPSVDLLVRVLGTHYRYLFG